MNKENIDSLYQKYLEIIKLETTLLGCKPTELRHLIGRIGEFYCALHTDGELAILTNQKGFDVKSKDGRRISVKTTAQKGGFVSINKNTIDNVDELMIIQFLDNQLVIIFYDSIEIVKQQCRTWENKFEFDISKAKLLSNLKLNS